MYIRSHNCRQTQIRLAMRRLGDHPSEASLAFSIANEAIFLFSSIRGALSRIYTLADIERETHTRSAPQPHHMQRWIYFPLIKLLLVYSRGAPIRSLSLSPPAVCVCLLQFADMCVALFAGGEELCRNLSDQSLQKMRFSAWLCHTLLPLCSLYWH